MEPDTDAVAAAELHPADEGDTTTLSRTLAAAEADLEAVDAAPTVEDPAGLVTDKGYHSRAVPKDLDDGPWKTRLSEPVRNGVSRWHGDEAARRAVTNNRARLASGVAREAFRRRAGIVARSFAQNPDRSFDGDRSRIRSDHGPEDTSLPRRCVIGPIKGRGARIAGTMRRLAGNPRRRLDFPGMTTTRPRGQRPPDRPTRP